MTVEIEPDAVHGAAGTLRGSVGPLDGLASSCDTFTTRWPPVARQPYPRDAPDLAVPEPDPTITMQLCIGVAPAAVLDGAQQAERGGG